MMLRVYRNHWDELSGKSCRTLEELDRAETVIHRMVHLLGLKNLGVSELTRTAEMRNRAFTYLGQALQSDVPARSRSFAGTTTTRSCTHLRCMPIAEAARGSRSPRSRPSSRSSLRNPRSAPMDRS